MLVRVFERGGQLPSMANLSRPWGQVDLKEVSSDLRAGFELLRAQLSTLPSAGSHGMEYVVECEEDNVLQSFSFSESDASPEQLELLDSLRSSMRDI